MREYWIKVWEVLFGWEPGNDILTPLPAALFVFFSVLANGLVLYHVTKAIVPEPIKEYALDFIKTMTLCSYFVGHVLMWKGFGVPALALGILLALLITSIALKDGAGSPVNVWVAYFENLIPLRKCLFKTAIQTWAGFSAYHFAMFLISVEFNPVYTELLQPYNAGRCDSHLKVPILKGALIEFAGTFYMVWIMYQKLMKNKGLDQLLKLVNIVFIVILGKSCGTFCFTRRVLFTGWKRTPDIAPKWANITKFQENTHSEGKQICIFSS